MIDDVARLRAEVFAEYPYLYDGTAEYEALYLGGFAGAEGAIIVAVYDGDRVVGAATGAPLTQHNAEFADAFAGTGIDITKIFYCAESVLLPAYRGQGLGHAFFDQREAHARRLGLTQSAFCSVIRPDNHPQRPLGYNHLDQFWLKRGYRILPGVIASTAWKEIGGTGEVEHPMQFWLKDLEPPA